jgi:hypothetical protein
VGSNGDEPVTAVRGADGRCGNTVPDNIKPERGQGLEDFLPDQSLLDGEEIGDVLQDDVTGSKLAHDSCHLSPQNGLGVPESLSLAGGACSLAGEPADNAVDRLKIASTELPNVLIYRYARPALAKHLSPPGVGLTKPFMLHASEMQAVIQKAHAREKRPELQHMYDSASS